MHPRAFLPVTLVAGLALSLAAACSSPTEGALGPNLAKGAGTGDDPTVDAVDPPSAPQDTTLDVSVLGSNYDRGSTVEMLLAGQPTAKVRTNSTRFKNPGVLIANITIQADADLASYDVAVTTSGGKKGIGIEKFTVTEGPVPVVITMREGSSGTDAVRADDIANTPYLEPGHLVGVNGYLMFWLGDGSPRAVRVTTTAFDGVTRRRIFTNNHTNPDGDDAMGFLGMASGSTGSAVFEVEIFSKFEPYNVVRYGKDCAGTGSGGGNVVVATKVVTTRSADGNTWTITGSSGVHCKQVTKKPGLVQVGTAGPFQMTLVRAVP